MGIMHGYGTARVEYTVPFDSTPAVTVEPSRAGVWTQVTDNSPSGFSVSLWTSAGHPAAATFRWAVS